MAKKARVLSPELKLAAVRRKDAAAPAGLPEVAAMDYPEVMA